MRTVVISDCHIGALDSDVNALLHFLRQLDCDRLLIAGDLWELWLHRSTYMYGRFSECRTAFEALRKRDVRIEYLLGNHDDTYMSSPLLPLDLLPVVTHMEIELQDGRKLAVIHGHEYDYLIKWYYPLMRVGYWVKQALGSLTQFERSSVSSKKGHKRYTELVESIHREASKAYQQLGYAGLILGHTHFPVHRQSENFLLVNAGCWKGSNTFVEVEGDQVDLKHFELK
jgi:UDP-2,3-diacylglucosamine pyrophosphatase LpxH